LYTIQADVSDTEGMKRAVASLPPSFKEVDVLVNNAGFAAGLGSAHECKLEDWHAIVETNIKGVLTTTHLLLPGFVERKRGHVVMMGSVASRYPYPGGNVYGGTKAFVHQFAMNLRADLLGKNVRVTNLLPGMCETEFSLVRFGGDEERAKKVYEGMQALSAEDMAEVVYWTTTLPAHVNVNALELMPTQQAFSPFAVVREKKEGEDGGK
jgi:3-hydroxy acid dehydrogenase/malonic semialdehyde reductase